MQGSEHAPPEDGTRSLHFGRDDGHALCSTFVQRGRSKAPVSIWPENVDSHEQSDKNRDSSRGSHARE
jgi:hypothetical protein